MNIISNALRVAMLAVTGVLLVAAAERGQAAELLMFKEEGCPWCMKFDREVGRIYANTPEGKVAPLKRVDVDDVPAKYDFVGYVHFTPTFVLVDDEKHVIGRIIGYQGFDWFWEQLDIQLKKLKEHEAKKAAGGVSPAMPGQAAPRG